MNVAVMPIVASVLVLSGALFTLLGAVGVLRLPDCYSRMHAASKAGALGAALILGGVATASSGEVALEAILALLVLLGTAPLAAHAVSRAAHSAGIRPIVGPLGNVMEQETAAARERIGAPAILADEEGPGSIPDNERPGGPASADKRSGSVK